MFKCDISERIHYSRPSTIFPYPIHCRIGPPFHPGSQFGVTLNRLLRALMDLVRIFTPPNEECSILQHYHPAYALTSTFSPSA